MSAGARRAGGARGGAARARVRVRVPPAAQRRDVAGEDGAMSRLPPGAAALLLALLAEVGPGARTMRGGAARRRGARGRGAPAAPRGERDLSAQRSRVSAPEDARVPGRGARAEWGAGAGGAGR